MCALLIYGIKGLNGSGRQALQQGSTAHGVQLLLAHAWCHCPQHLHPPSMGHCGMTLRCAASWVQAMERIHAILPDGSIVRDVEVFRRLYEAVGLGWVYAITKNPSVLNAANAVYGVWAKYRTQITGREALEVILQRHRAATAGSLCRNPDGSSSGEACELPSASSSTQGQGSQQ